MNAEQNIYTSGQVLLIDKPLGWTSFDAVRTIRNLVQTKKVGHAGTLDPLATGLLIICTGKFTKSINQYMAQEKEYTGTITLGSTTPTFDLESEPVQFQPYAHLTAEQIIEGTEKFTGPIHQVPPVHSAIKQGGTRVYTLARKGIEVVMQPRQITIHEFSIEEIALPLVHFKVVCSTGTYIRSLANDFGEHLGCGGHLSSLRRTRIGAFKVEDAQTVKAFEEQMKAKQ
jgi:tRNA pseudouridine55 synthase